MYGLQHGPNEDSILKNAYRSKLPIPPVIQNAPDLLPGLGLFYDAFKRLTSCRGAAYNSEGPIPWTAMRAYCIDAEIENEDRDYFYEVIGSMDATYLNFKTEKLKAAQSK